MLEELTSRGQHEWLLNRVLALDGITRDSSVLDLGCGTGAWLDRLAGAGFAHLLGVDKSREHFGAEVPFIQADLTADARGVELSLYDLITCIEVIEHVANPEAILKFAAQHLAPDGWLVVTTPNIYSVRARARFLLTGKLTWFEHNAHFGHIHPCVIAGLERDVLPRIGLKIVAKLSYPEYGSDGTRWFARIAERGLSLVLPNDLPGDSLCLLLRRSTERR